MKIHFYKYQGTGNDFVIIDDREEKFPVEDYNLVSKLCDRKFGVGADGLMLLRGHDSYDFEMIYFNADGHLGSMCGNGGRALVKFAHDLGVINDECLFIASDGEHRAKVQNGLIHLHMIDVQEIEFTGEDYYMDTGSPHYVEFLSSKLSEFDVNLKGRNVRNSSRFSPDGTNVNFVESISKSEIFVRTYERGVEDETLSCGTGVTACAIASFLEKEMDSPIAIKVLGGNLSVSFDATEEGFENIYLIGPAERVFEGDIEL